MFRKLGGEVPEQQFMDDPEIGELDSRFSSEHFYKTLGLYDVRVTRGDLSQERPCYEGHHPHDVVSRECQIAPKSRQDAGQETIGSAQPRTGRCPEFRH
jgi:hypothetical protein